MIIHYQPSCQALRNEASALPAYTNDKASLISFCGTSVLLSFIPHSLPHPQFTEPGDCFTVITAGDSEASRGRRWVPDK